MIHKFFKIMNKLGLHARPAAIFVQKTSRYKSEITVTKNGQRVSGRSIMGLMMLAAGKGSEIEIIANGPDEKEMVKELGEFIEKKFDEE